jgi:DNA-binding CsgD family transcriptional regulator
VRPDSDTSLTLTPRTLTALVEPLTPREHEVLCLLTEASTSQDIADRLCISLRTVETHLGHIYGKLGVRGRVEAMLWAIRVGVVRIGG